MQFFPGKKKIEGCLRAIRIWCFVFIDKSIRILTVVEAPPFEHRVTLNFINFPQIGGPSNLKRARFESTGCFKWIFTSWLTSFHLSPRRIVLNVFHTVFVLLFFFFLDSICRYFKNHKFKTNLTNSRSIKISFFERDTWWSLMN